MELDYPVEHEENLPQPRWGGLCGRLCARAAAGGCFVRLSPCGLVPVWSGLCEEVTVLRSML